MMLTTMSTQTARKLKRTSQLCRRCSGVLITLSESVLVRLNKVLRVWVMPFSPGVVCGGAAAIRPRANSCRLFMFGLIELII